MHVGPILRLVYCHTLRHNRHVTQYFIYSIIQIKTNWIGRTNWGPTKHNSSDLTSRTDGADAIVQQIKVAYHQNVRHVGKGSSSLFRAEMYTPQQIGFWPKFSASLRAARLRQQHSFRSRRTSSPPRPAPHKFHFTSV